MLVPASSLAIVGVAALVFAMTHVHSNERQLFLAPAGLTAQQTQAPRAQSDPNGQVLQEALGDDFVVREEHENPGGNVTVRPGSPSAEGLPSGLTLWTQLLVLQQSPESGELTQFCKPMVEKNVIFSACTQRVLPEGKAV